tara:strand:- start:230291 stop:231283 length:993 start_codon:yes stop_codon:yes gene_type:complete
MLEAVVTDLLAIPDCTVTTSVQVQLPFVNKVLQQAERSPRLQIQRVKTPDEEQALFERACQQADVVWVIAPEFDGLLVSRTEWALQSGAHVVGPDLHTIQLTADKWRLFEFLNERSLPTIPTLLLKDEQTVSEASFPCLIKHRFGAGGLGLQSLAGAEDWRQRRADYEEQRSDFIMQPFLTGRALSTVVLADSHRSEIFPIGEQQISWKSDFEYQGGVMPAKVEPEVIHSIHELISRVCDLLPGLVGYVGFDILLPDTDPMKPLIVEINPRMTTSYVGYRHLTPDNLAERIVKGNTGFPSLKWNLEQEVRFQPDGSLFLNQSRSLEEKKN